MEKEKKMKWSRREFIKTTGAVAAGFAMGGSKFLTNAHAQEVIKGLALLPMTRALTFFGEAVASGTQDYFTMINDQGGVKGRKLELEVADTQYLTDVGIAQFRRVMAKTPRPLLLFSGETGLTKAVTRIIEQEFPRQIVYLGLSQSVELWAPKEHPYFFVMGPTYEDEGRACLRWVHELGAKKIVVVRSDGAWGRDFMPGTREGATKLDIKILEEVIADIGAIDLTSQALRVKALNPDAIIIFGYLHEEPARLMKILMDYGITANKLPAIMASWSTNKDFVSAAEEAAEGVYGISHVSYWWEQHKPGIKKIVDFNKKHHPNVDYRSDYYIRAWICAMAGVEGIRRASKITGEAVKEAIESIVDFDTGGVSPKLNLKTHKLTDQTVLYQVKKGQLTSIKELSGGPI